MKATIRLLTTVSVAIPSRGIHDAIFDQAQKIFHMSELPLQQLFLKNLRKSASVPDAVVSTYISIVESMAKPSTHQEFTKTIMEPFLEAYYNSTGTSTTCNIPLSLPPSNAVNHQSIAEYPMGGEEKRSVDKQKYKAMRMWKQFKKEKLVPNSDEFFVLRLLSFNILAQNLLESYPYLYKKHDKQALAWHVRKELLLEEILQAQANVICLQEMQEEHLTEFLAPFKELGYEYLYKKRTNQKRDGLLFLYRADQLTLLDYTKVELYQSGINLLSRDNVGIIAKLCVKDNPDIQIVIATTHLLYNPRRNDVRLGQTQLLLAEIERIAFIENTMTGPKYLPIILSGDFNLEPYTGVYQFITQGSFEYIGKGKNLEWTHYNTLTNCLIPPRLCVTDNCQHFNILIKRLRGEGTGKVMLRNSENCNKDCNAYMPFNMSMRTSNEVNLNTCNLQTIEIIKGHHVKFSSVMLSSLKNTRCPL
ncbi:hypothetical protein KM043_008509 [Ampulex compressa]|nr:hypothetical protein KM043_008509 [Ampulex compressa]